ncbi:MAG: LexA family transcriptional regulator [Legionella longbeachae]|nr:LexA family transcriptional regulator [Legionella longbeachae]
MSEINKEIGLRIAESRKKKGMTAIELSKITGFSSARISHWEQGRRLPNLESILVLEEALNVPAAYLLCVDSIQRTPELSCISIPLHKLTEINESKPVCSISVSIPMELDSKYLFAVKLLDDSMHSLFRKDDIVVFKTNKEIVDGAFVLFQINKTGQKLFRKYLIDNKNIENPLYKFIALNPDYENITTPNKESFTVLGICNDSIRLFL